MFLIELLIYKQMCFYCFSSHSIYIQVISNLIQIFAANCSHPKSASPIMKHFSWVLVRMVKRPYGRLDGMGSGLNGQRRRRRPVECSSSCHGSRAQSVPATWHAPLYVYVSKPLACTDRKAGKLRDRQSARTTRPIPP